MLWVNGITWAWYIWHQIIEKAIEFWYIKKENITIPEWIIESRYCLDSKCFRKELIYKSSKKEYFSRILDGVFDKRDLKENLSEFERQKIEDMWFEFR